MRTDFDFSPYYRATVGFDRVFDLLDSVASQTGAAGYPPYNIERAGDDAYRIVMAVAGFSQAELNVTQKESELLISGKAQPSAEEKEYLYRGIAKRDTGDKAGAIADFRKALEINPDLPSTRQALQELGIKP